MQHFVSIQNRSLIDSVEVDTYTIEPLGKLKLSYDRYFDLSLENKLEDMNLEVVFPILDIKSISVKDFGAAGDGVTDDTKAFDKAVSFLSAYGGGIINVPIGVYLIGPLDMKANIYLYGESKMDSVLKFIGMGASILSFCGANGGCSRLRIVGNG